MEQPVEEWDGDDEFQQVKMLRDLKLVKDPVGMLYVRYTGVL